MYTYTYIYIYVLYMIIGRPYEGLQEVSEEVHTYVHRFGAIFLETSIWAPGYRVQSARQARGEEDGIPWSISHFLVLGTVCSLRRACSQGHMLRCVSIESIYNGCPEIMRMIV